MDLVSVFLSHRSQSVLQSDQFAFTPALLQSCVSPLWRVTVRHTRTKTERCPGSPSECYPIGKFQVGWLYLRRLQYDRVRCTTSSRPAGSTGECSGGGAAGGEVTATLAWPKRNRTSYDDRSPRIENGVVVIVVLLLSSVEVPYIELYWWLVCCNGEN